jgi:hypothetical protein
MGEEKDRRKYDRQFKEDTERLRLYGCGPWPGRSCCWLFSHYIVDIMKALFFGREMEAFSDKSL